MRGGVTRRRRRINKLVGSRNGSRVYTNRFDLHVTIITPRNIHLTLTPSETYTLTVTSRLIHSPHNTPATPQLTHSPHTLILLHSFILLSPHTLTPERSSTPRLIHNHTYTQSHIHPSTHPPSINTLTHPLLHPLTQTHPGSHPNPHPVPGRHRTDWNEPPP